VSRMFRGSNRGRPARSAVLGIALSVAVIVGTSLAVYALAGDYVPVFEDANLKVDLKVININMQPQKHAIVLVSVRMLNKSPSTIDVTSFRVLAFDSPAREIKYGEDVVSGLVLPAGKTIVKNLNLKVQNFTLLLGDDDVFVQTSIQWTHFGQSYSRLDAKLIDITPWKSLLGVSP